MGGSIGQIGNALANGGRRLASLDPGGATPNSISNFQNSVNSLKNGDVKGSLNYGINSDPTLQATYVANDVGGEIMGHDTPPQAPGVNTDLENLKNQQVQQAKDFRSNLPQTQKTLSSNLAQESNINTNNNMRMINQSNNKRGLLYGGVNQGMKSQERAQGSANLAKSVGLLNNGLNDAANQMDINAINTGVGIQQSSQKIQNDLYSQAQAQLSSNNNMSSSIASLGMLAALLL